MPCVVDLFPIVALDPLQPHDRLFPARRSVPITFPVLPQEHAHVQSAAPLLVLPAFPTTSHSPNRIPERSISRGFFIEVSVVNTLLNSKDPGGIRNKRIAAAVATAIALAVPAEGLRRVAYGDIANPKLLTVCYGATGKGVEAGRTYSIDECRARLTADMLEAVDVVDKCQPGLPLEVLAAFADAAYNVGPTIACDTGRSTAARLLVSRRYAEACDQLLRWNRARVGGVMVALPGLTKRRAAERDVCLRGAA